MHPHLATVLDTLDDSRAMLRRALDGIPSPQRSLKPAPERWSAADVVEHLSLAETNFTNWIAAGIEAARAGGLAPERSDRAPLAEDVRERLRNRVNRRVAPDRVQPRGMEAEAAWAALSAVERRLREVLATADGLALNEVRVAHPTLGTFSVYQWIELIAAHRCRHAEQIDEIAAGLTQVG